MIRIIDPHSLRFQREVFEVGRWTFQQEGILEIPSAQEKMVMNSLGHSPKETDSELVRHH
jgi:hypothetical protein